MGKSGICLVFGYTLKSWPGQVCRVRIGKLGPEDVQVRTSHARCGRAFQQLNSLVCSFCGGPCDDREAVPEFMLRTVFYDSGGDAGVEVVAWCAGQAAAEIMQACPSDFCSWPEVLDF